MNNAKNIASRSKNPQTDETNLFLLNIMFLVAIMALVVLLPEYGVRFTSFSVITSFIASCFFIYLT